MHLKIHMGSQETLKSQNNLKKRTKLGVSCFMVSKHHKHTAINTVWHWHEDRQTSNSRNKPSVRGSIIRKEAKPTQRGRYSLSNKQGWENGDPLEGKAVSPFLAPYTKTTQSGLKSET